MVYPDMRTDPAAPVDWAAAAQAAIRAWCGWHIAPVLTETVLLDVRHVSRDLQLPTTRLLETVSVEVIDSREETGWRELAEHEYQWSEAGVLRRTDCLCWPKGFRTVRVTMRHGYEPAEVPDVLGIADKLASRARVNSSGVASQSVNGASVSYQTAGGAPLAAMLLQIEKQALAAYKVGLGRIPG